MTDHILPTRVYYTIFGILMLCTYLTVQIAFLDLGRLNAIAALGIAVFKATLVVLYFMHVKYSPKLTWAVVLGSVFWLSHPAGAHDGRLPDSGVAHVRVTGVILPFEVPCPITTSLKKRSRCSRPLSSPRTTAFSSLIAHAASSDTTGNS